MEFTNLSKKIKNEIETKKDVDNTDNKSGIYSIYIDNFDYKKMKYQERIIPIYIGQSKNIYKRVLTHKNKLKTIFSYSINEFNKNLKNKKESQYLYHKIRKCINDTDITEEHIKFKVLEYCEESELLDREKYYIDLYKSESFGLNQYSSVQKIVTSNVDTDTEEQTIDILTSIDTDTKQILLDKSNNNGFSSFNASMLCYNTRIFLKKMEGKERNPKNTNKYSEKVIIKFNETLDLWGKLLEETDLYFEPGIPDFIGEDLKLENK